MAVYSPQILQDTNINKTLTIGATSVQILQAKTRKVLYIRNTSLTQTITIALDNFNVAVAGSGIILLPNEYFLDSADGSGYLPWNGIISAVSSSSGGTLSIMEMPYTILGGKLY